MLAMPDVFDFSPHLKEGWQEPQHLLEAEGHGLSPRLRAALGCTSSLTRHLENAWQEPVRVWLESQELSPKWVNEPPVWEARHQLPQRGDVLLRNAWLGMGAKKWVFAHSQVAVADLAASVWAGIERGETPLGALFLDREDRVSRLGLELTLARAPQFAHNIGLSGEVPFWCRRSLFVVNGSPWARILEVFVDWENHEGAD
ncbi:MAG: chorismate lyase [Magnetococcales bacterium]|nr:chorismate lyase [Magnetococcales bacterium]